MNPNDVNPYERVNQIGIPALIKLGVPFDSILPLGSESLVITKELDLNTQDLISQLANENGFTVQFVPARQTPAQPPEKPPEKIEVSYPRQTRPVKSTRNGFFYKLDTNTVRTLSKASRGVQMQLKRDHMILLLALMSHCGTSNECFPSLQTLQEVTDMSRSHVSEMLRGLIQCGLVERRRTGRANVYRIRCL